MKRLFVTNSMLAYPPPPREMLGDDDAVLPLAERFEEALFMPSRFYEGVYNAVPAIRAEATDLLDRLRELLPDTVTRDPGWGHSAWDVITGVLLKFTMGPLLVNNTVLQAAAQAEPEEVIAWELPRDSSWWSGRQMVDAISREIAERTGARLTLRASQWRRRLRSVALPATTGVLTRRYFRARARLPEPPATTRCDILFANVGPTLLPLFERIGTRLLDEHGLSVLGVEVPLDPSWRGLTVESLPHTHLYAHTTPAMISSGIAEARAAAIGARRAAAAMRQWVDGARLGPHLGEVLVRRIIQALIHLAPVGAYHARLWERVLDMARPRVLVTFNSYNEAVAPGVLQAGRRGIATICCQHGIWGPLFKAGVLLPYDDVLVFGEYARELLQPIAAAHTRFTITGHSDYDDATISPDIAPPPEGPPVVLVTTQPMGHRLALGEPCQWVEVTAEACRTLGARMIIKPHPHERDVSPWQRLAERMPETMTFMPHGQRPLNELIAECSVLATRFSTTAMEAVLAGRPVLAVYPTGGPEQYPFAEDGAAVKANSCEEIQACLRRLLSDDATRRNLAAARAGFIQRHIGPVDGRATERIAALIADRASRA
ncbi:MAG: hypothetical protein J7M38_03985 [Armatimonadetes bacterium]|nr:hypothetical protein [Armatimonadota bacterium]